MKSLPWLKQLLNAITNFIHCKLQTQVWLLQLCLPSLTESGGIDGPKQFGALTSHTLIEKHEIF